MNAIPERRADGVQQSQVRLHGGALAVGQYGSGHRSALPVSASSPPRPAARTPPHGGAPPSLPPTTDNPAFPGTGSPA